MTYKHLDHEVIIHKSKLQEAIEWCHDQYGDRWGPILSDQRKNRWTVFWAGTDHFEYYRFCFALEKEANWFALRWS